VHAQRAGAERPWWAVEPVKTELLAGSDLAAVRGGAELAEVRAARHVLLDGRTLWALAGVVTADEIVVAYRDDTGRVEALRYRVVGEVAELRAVSAGGVVQYPVGAAGGDFSPASCPPGAWPCPERRCCRLNLRAALYCCATLGNGLCSIPCTFLGNLLCASCVAIACPICLIYSCQWWCNCCWNDPPWGP